MKKILFLLSLALFVGSYTSSAQREIRDGIFLYGNLENSLRGKLLVVYKIVDPASETLVLDELERYNKPFVNYHDYFFPQTNYEAYEIDSFLKEKNIETIIYVTMKDVSTVTTSVSTTLYSDLLKSAFTFGGNKTSIASITLFFEIRNVKDGFKRPIAMLQATGKNNLYYKDFEGTMARTIRLLMKCLEEEAAFGGPKKPVPASVDMELEMKKYINR
jgi:hypothetical protein